MATLTVSEARSQLYRLIDEVAESHEPALINGERNHVVILSEADWRSIQGTLHLLAFTGMRESIHDGIATPVDECETDPGW